jgi:uncharacterized membrane protein YcaP (DUF421 family)
MQDVNMLEMLLRTIVIYFATLTIVRLGSRRMLGAGSAFDVVVGIMLGSIMSRAINSDAPLLPTLGSGAALVALHWLIATLAYHVDWLGPIVKGSRHLLVRDGQVREDALREANLTRRDVVVQIRSAGRERFRTRNAGGPASVNSPVNLGELCAKPCRSLNRTG